MKKYSGILVMLLAMVGTFTVHPGAQNWQATAMPMIYMGLAGMILLT